MACEAKQNKIKMGTLIILSMQKPNGYRDVHINNEDLQ